MPDRAILDVTCDHCRHRLIGIAFLLEMVWIIVRICPVCD